MSLYKLGLALSASCIIGGCVAAPPLTPAEEAAREELSSDNFHAAPREIRDNIETQDVLAQAAFWSHEYNLNPTDLEAAIKFSAVLRKMGNPSRAVEVTRTTRALYPKDPYLNAEHAAGLIADQQARPALKIIDGALRDAPSYARLWSLKGVAYDQMERYAQARPFYNRALQITPNDPNIMANMGLNFALSGDPHTAQKWLQRAAALPTASDSVYANLALVEGLVAEAGPHTPTPSYTAPNRYAPPTNRAQTPAAAPRQYGAYQTPQTAAPQYGAPTQRTATQTSPYGNTRRAAQTNRPSGGYPAYNNTTQQAPQFAAPQAQAKATQPQSLQQVPTAEQPISTSADVLSRIAKNVGPKPATAPQLSQRLSPYEGGPARGAQQGFGQQGFGQQGQTQRPPQQQAYNAAPNYPAQPAYNNGAPTQYNGQYSGQYNQQAGYNNGANSYQQNAPQLRGGYPAPPAPYYNNTQANSAAPERRSAARRR